MTSRSLPTAFLGLIALTLAMLVFGCGPIEKLPQAPMPAGATYTGLWYSDFDDMRLVQEGNTVTGTFEYKDGGTLAGTLEGGVLVFEWVQTGDLNVGRREVRGRGYFVISNDGQQITGRWGYGDSHLDGGEWNGEKAKIDYENQ